jgi:hypothetical protein
MCEPTTMLALTIASSAAGLYQQQQTMKAHAASNQAQYDNQMTAFRYNQANNQLSRVQEAENLAQQKLNNNSAATRALSSARVAAGESGVSGLSVDALLADLAGRAGVDNTTAETNYLRRDRAIQADQMNNWAGTASAINKLETPKTPDYLGAALKIGGAVQDYRAANPGSTKAGPVKGYGWGVDYGE